MAKKRPLTQDEIDAVFRGSADTADAAPDVQAFDFSKLDSIKKSELESLHVLHEDFARNLSSSLSAYFRSQVSLNLISLEQLDFGEFLEGISPPGCLAYLSLEPYDGNAVLDLNANLVFGLVELLLGAKEQTPVTIRRKITEIEKGLMQMPLRLILRDLQNSWRTVAKIDFSVQSIVGEPQLLNMLSPTETMLIIAVEVQLGTTAGLINLAIPASFIKRLRNNFDRLQGKRKSEPTDIDQQRIVRLLQDAKLKLDVQIAGGTIDTKTLVALQPGDVISLDYPADQPVSGLLNGKEKWTGMIVTQSSKLAFKLVDNVVAS